MEVKEYVEKEGDKSFELSKINPGYLTDAVYSSGRDTLTRTCHDIFLRVKSDSDDNEGILLIKRKQNPFKNLFWCVGGGKKRGIPFYESIKNTVKEECNLEVEGHPLLIDVGEFYFRTNHFGTPWGVDDFVAAFYAKGNGNLKLNDLHSEYMIVSKENFSKISEGMHPYLKNNMKKIFDEYW